MISLPCRSALPLACCIGAFLALGLTGCTAVGSLLYDQAVMDQRQACEQLRDPSAYRACLDKVRTVEQQADDQRKKR